MISAKVIKDSIGDDAPRLITFELEYPRFVHAEFMTHRVFSRNASSSRAIPVERMLERVNREPALPVEWRMNEAGMQGFTVADDETAYQATMLWAEARDHAVRCAQAMLALGIHKQHVNRLTEPFQHIKVVVTSSQWENWFGLRDHEAAEPTIQALARAMKIAMDTSTPTKLQHGEWHLPYVLDEDREIVMEFLTTKECPHGLPLLEILKRMSAARCARVSYNNFKGLKPKVSSDLSLFEKLVGSQPVHASPTEHQASPDILLGFKSGRWNTPERHGNLTGWLQFRKFIPFENLEAVG